MILVRFFLYSLSLFLISFTLFGHLAAYYYYIYKPKKLFICECTHTARERKKLGEYLLYAKRYLNLRCFFVRFTQSVHKIHSSAAILCLSDCVVLFLHTDGIDVSVLLTTNWLNAVDECTTTIEIHCQFIWYWVVLDVYFHFFSVFNVEIIAILHLQRGNIPRCCVDTSSNLSEERKKPTQKRLRQFSGLVIWHTILRIVRECGWGFSCEFKHVLLWIIDQISRHSIPKISHLPTNTCVAFERCFAVASSHKNAAPSIWSDGAAYAEHTVRVFRNKSPTNRPWAWNLEDSRIREARASQPANVFTLILSLCVSDTFLTIARSSAFAGCYFSANFYDAHHQYHLRISFFSRTHLIASRPIIWTRWKPRKIFVPIPYHMCTASAMQTHCNSIIITKLIFINWTRSWFFLSLSFLRFVRRNDDKCLRLVRQCEYLSKYFSSIFH